MNATRAFLDGILKHKPLFLQNPDAASRFIYDEQECLRTLVLGEPDLSLANLRR
jgi:hypothetical protein